MPSLKASMQRVFTARILRWRERGRWRRRISRSVIAMLRRQFDKRRGSLPPTSFDLKESISSYGNAIQNSASAIPDCGFTIQRQTALRRVVPRSFRESVLGEAGKVGGS